MSEGPFPDGTRAAIDLGLRKIYDANQDMDKAEACGEECQAMRREAAKMKAYFDSIIKHFYGGQ